MIKNEIAFFFFLGVQKYIYKRLFFLNQIRELESHVTMNRKMLVAQGVQGTGHHYSPYQTLGQEEIGPWTGGLVISQGPCLLRTKIGQIEDVTYLLKSLFSINKWPLCQLKKEKFKS